MDDIRPVFNQLNIVSADLSASIDFYRRLGVAIPDGRVWPMVASPHHASASESDDTQAPQLDLDSIDFARRWNGGWKNQQDLRGRVLVGVGARESVDRLHAAMTGAGYRSLQAPYDAFWGARYAVIEDPDGIAVGLMSDISPAHRSPPPEV